MRIIHVAQFLGIGGLEKVIYHLAHEQQKQGHLVEIYIYDYERTWVEFFRKNGLTVITPELKKPGYDFSLLMRMKRDLFSADVIHSHDLNPLMYLGPINLWKKLTFQKKNKLIHTTHGLDHVDNYPRAKLYQRMFSRMADKIVAVSDKIENFYRDEIKLSSKKVMTIQNGIATFEGIIDEQIKKNKKLWITKKHQLDENKPLIVSLSRIVPLKDQLFLIKALKQRPQYQLLVVGPASDQDYFDSLKKFEDENISFAGAQELVTDYNLGCDLYVSASTHEGIPVAVLEAMAVETPCLISDIPGHQTLLKHGSSVEIFKLHDTQEFLEKLDCILKNEEESKLRAKKGRALVEEYYSVKSMNSEYLQVYES